MTAEAHHLASELDKLDGEMKASQEETGKLASLRAEKDKAETDKNKLEADKKKVEAEKDKAEEDKENAEAQISSEVTKRKNLETQLAKLKAEKTQEDVDLHDTKNKLKLAEEDKKKKVEEKKTNDALENKLQTAQAAVQSEEDQIKALKKDLNADEKNIKSLRHDYEKQLAELQAMKKRKGGAQPVEDHRPRHRRSRRRRGRGSRRHHGIQLDSPHAADSTYDSPSPAMERKRMRVGHKVHRVQELDSQVEPYRQEPRKSNKINLEANTPTATEIKAEVATEETPLDTTVKVKETIAEKFEEPVHVAAGEELDDE